MAEKAYPEPGSNAELILDHIQKNPGVTTNGIIRALSLNPGPTRGYLARLIEKGRIIDTMEGQVHHYEAKAPAL